jgi:Dyp-type peroxidase family
MAASAKPCSNGRIPAEWADMQGLVLSSYPHLDQAAYLLFQIDNAKSARVWLRGLCEHVTPALKKASTKNYRCEDRQPPNLNIAFTHWGLKKLWPDVEHFSDAFEQGIYGYVSDPSRDGAKHPETHRSRLLGDRGANDPDEWQWGGPRGGEKKLQVDVLLMVFAHCNDPLQRLVDDVMPGGEIQDAATLAHSVIASRLSEMKEHEHFGFKDGISQPILEGSSDAERFPDSIHVTALGEIVLGHYNAAGRALGKADRYGRTAPLPSASGDREFGMNGSYLVVRQLEQDVDAFWRWITNASGAANKDEPNAQQLAAKLIGRWPDGTPLVPYANLDDNEFLFDEDPYGYGCPIGAHVRRTNPRKDIDQTRLPLRLSNDHRILRRGRSYGSRNGGERGLMFLCLNADISASSSSFSRPGSTACRSAGSTTSSIP